MITTRIAVAVFAALFCLGCPPPADDDTGEADDDATATDDDVGDDDAGDDDTVPDDPLVYLTAAPMFGDTFLGCDSTGVLELRNDSEQAVTVDVIEVDPGVDAFSPMTSGPPPWEVAAGHAMGLGVAFHPQVLDESTGTLRITTDHPDYPEVTGELSGVGVGFGGGMDQWTGAAEAVVDLLWVVDNSCSMIDEQINLANMATAFVDYLVTTSADYQIGVIATDGPMLRGTPGFATPADPDVPTWFSTTVQLGTMGGNIEEPLKWALEAVTPPLTDPGEPNEGFVRDAAHLALFVLTDEDDQSPNPVMQYVDALVALKDGDADRLTINIVAGLAQGCEGPLGNASPTPRLLQAAQVTGGAAVSICDPDWMPVLSQLPELQSFDPGIYPLSEPAMPETIEVYVNEVLTETGWSYESGDSCVVFDTPSIPGDQDQVKIIYIVPAEADSC